MATRDELLATKTFKGQFDTLNERVYYTLAGDDRTSLPAEIWLHRVTKCLAELSVMLKSKEILSEADIDQMLYESIEP